MSEVDVAIHKVIHVENIMNNDEFLSFLTNLSQEYPENPLFFLFTGAKTNGRSWCGDCNRAEPIILATLEEYSPNAVLVVFPVQRELFRSQTFEYRVNPLIQLKCVPTLHRFRNGESVRSLDDNECQEAQFVRTLVCES